MAETPNQSEIGSLLRRWRESKHLTQLQLALDAGVSARHLSFVETGRSRPGREMLLRIGEQVGVPFRERNRMLLAGGFAPAFPERPWDDPDLAPVRDALDLVLSSHEPYPAVAVDRVWNMVAANSGMLALLEGIEIAPELLEPPINVLRIGLHPRGMAPLMVNIGDWHAHWIRHLEHQVATTGDERLASLLDEIGSYPVAVAERDATAGIAAEEMLGPVRMRTPRLGELSFFGMFANFDTPFEVTTSELAVELLFPADAATAEKFRRRADRAPRP
jgi:transcriptional regulator with XRE-family HTH domain